MKKVLLSLSLLYGTLAASAAYDPPVTFTPTQAQFNECLLDDGNDDGKKWELKDGSFHYSYHLNNAANDWCILPAINCNQGAYKVTFSYKTRSKSNLENFRLAVGNARNKESMTTTLLEKQDYGNDEYVTESRTFEVTTPGEWYLGLYAFSEKNKFGIYFKDITIEKLDTRRPKAPELTALFDGYDGTVTITFPTQTLAGNPLTGTLSTQLLIDGTPYGNVLTGQPGNVKTVAVTMDKSGMVNFSAVVTATVGSEQLLSEPGVLSYDITKKQPIPLPLGYVMLPDEDEYKWCTVVNNSAGNEWQLGTQPEYYTNSVSPVSFKYSQSWGADADTWIILPAYDGTEGGAKRLSFTAATNTNKESLEVAVASSPDIDVLKENIVWRNEAFSNFGDFATQEAFTSNVAGENLYVAFHCFSPKNTGYLFIQNVTLEKSDGEMPLEPEIKSIDMDGGNGTVTVTLPSLNLDGNAIQGNVGLTVLVDGETYTGTVPEGAAGADVVFSLVDIAKGPHTLKATSYIVKNGEKVGAKYVETSFFVTLPKDFAYTLPFDLSLNKENIYDFKIIDANGDGNTWTGEDDSFHYKYSSTNEADDWFISAAIQVDDISKMFDVIMEAKTSSDKESWEIWIGQEPTIAGMTEKLLDIDEVSNTTYTPYEALATISETGKYYLGVHANSARNKYNIYVNRLQMHQSEQSNESPAAVTDLVGEGAETGEPTVTVTFRMPLTTLAGTELDPETPFTVTVSSDSESKILGGLPGQELTVTLGAPKGKSLITVYATNTEGNGKKARIEVETGKNAPADPVISKVTVDYDNMGALIEWEPVTTGVGGNRIDKDNLGYLIFEWDPDDEDWYQLGWGNECSYNYQFADPDEPQCMMTIGIQANNGINSNSAIVPVNVMLGVPVKLPVNDDFSGGKLSSPIAVGSSLAADYQPTWSIGNPSALIGEPSANDYSLIGHTAFNRGDSQLYLAKFSTEGIDEATFEMMLYYYPMTANFTIYGSTFGMQEPVKIAEISQPATVEGWKNFKYDLPSELMGMKWVELKLDVDFNGGSSVNPVIDSYVVQKKENAGISSATSECADMLAQGLSGKIRLSGFEGKQVSLFTPEGLLIKAISVETDEISVSMAPGIYIVTTPGYATKVAVN